MTLQPTLHRPKLRARITDALAFDLGAQSWRLFAKAIAVLTAVVVIKRMQMPKFVEKHLPVQALFIDHCNSSTLELER